MAAWVTCLFWSASVNAGPVVFDFESADQAAAWAVTGANATATVAPVDGRGTLACAYAGQPGAAFSVAVTGLEVAGVQSLTIRARASAQSPFSLILAEEDGSLYHTFATLPADDWCELAWPLTDFQLQDGSTDENDTLDAEQVRSLTLQELANMPGEWAEIFGSKLGEQVLSLDEVRFVGEARPSRGRSDATRVVVDDFTDPWFALLPLGGAQLSHVPGDAGRPAGLRVAFTFMPNGPRAWPGVVLPIGHVDLTEAQTLRLRVAAPGPLGLHVLLEEQDRSRYELRAAVPEADDWQARDFPFAQFTLEEGSTDENGALDASQLRVAIVVVDAWSALLDEEENGQFSLGDVLFLK
ncbi:MAG: hypothetical protein FJX74_13025 [Armatimonadetes bacterium]|nr:hypothetical protein [Armatimonadota bacterium]